MNDGMGYLSDAPAREDGLKLDAFRDSLLEILLNAETPLTVGVFGTWGSGKSTILSMLKREIDARKLHYLRTVWFTAWKYDKEDALWRSFVLRVVDGLYPGDENGERLAPEDLDDGQREAVALLDRLERAVYETVYWQGESRWALNAESLVKEGFRLPLWLASHLAGMGDVAGAIGLKPDLANLLERKVREYHMGQLQFMEQFSDEFEEAVRLVLRGEGSEFRGRLVVFVDDLDRCLPEKAVEILEAIKLFLDVPGTVFVIGMDREVIRRGIETHYGALLRSAVRSDTPPIDGDRYLEKIIQIPFNVPPLDVDARQDFISFLEEDLPQEFRLDDVTRQVIARGVFPTPRQAKRVLNIFNLLRQIVRNQVKQGAIEKDATSWPLLAKAVLIQTQWPEVYRWWRQYPTLVQTLEEEFAQRPVTEEEALKGRVPAQEGAERKPEEGGILGEIRENRPTRYSLLAEALSYPKRGEEDADKNRFEGLSRKQLWAYIALVGTVESVEGSAPPEVPLPKDWMSIISAGDEVKIRDMLSALAEQEPDADGPLHVSMRNRLLEQMRSSSVPVKVRVSSGNTLARLGDPRFDPKRWYLPDEPLLGFVPVPAGKFIMGSDPKKDLEASDDELPRHRLSLPAYYIARYPVTVAQFRAFVKESKYRPGDEDSLRGIDNHPVVLVTWYDALVYAGWLNERLREMASEKLAGARSEVEKDFWGGLKERRYRVTLPSEAEWEKAARGGLRLPALFFDPANPTALNFQSGTENPNPYRIYPWGDEPDPNRANYKDTGIGATSAVGCFPGGRSPYGVEEMSGNVWEWTRSLWGDYPYPKDALGQAGRESISIEKDDNRVFRGGSFGLARVFVRCSIRLEEAPNLGHRYLGLRVAVSPFGHDH